MQPADKDRSGPKTLTREGLKEILRVNFSLYKDEPDFFEYITTLVIYLMEYEYKKESPPQGETSEAPQEPQWTQGSTTSPGETIGRSVSTIPTKFRPRDGFCPHCNNPIPPDRKICPYCLALVET